MSKYKPLTKYNRMEIARNLPEIPKEYMELITDTGFATGSHMYGCGVEPDDLDFVVNLPTEVFEKYTIKANGTPRYHESETFTAIYGHHNGQMVNIMCVGDIDTYNAWYNTTKCMMFLATLPELQQALKDKWSRVLLFRAFRMIFTPPVPRETPLSFEYAMKYNRCRICGHHAEDFTCHGARRRYALTGVCERCDVPVDDIYKPIEEALYETK